jgi:hypothetical protein
MKNVIIYNNCLRSKIIYQKYISENDSDILGLVRVPNLSVNSENNLSAYLFKKFFKLPFCLQVYYFIQIVLYQIIDFFLNSGLQGVCKKKNIKHIYLPYVPTAKEIEKIFNISENYFIFCSTSTILKKKHLNTNRIILNFHEGDLPNWRGVSINFHLLLHSQKYTATCIFQPDLGIDTGKIVLKSNYFNIEGLSAFEILLLSLYSQSLLIFNVKNKKIKKFKSFRDNNDKNTYTFVSSHEINKIKLSKKKIFNFSDYFFCLRMILCHSGHDLESLILKRLKYDFSKTKNI